MARVSAVIDTNIFLNIKNREPLYFESSSAVIDAVDASKFRALVSPVTIAELSAGYNARKDLKGKQELFDHLLSTDGYKVVPVDTALADLSGEVRAATGVGLPDAMIISAGITEGASYIVTHDMEFAKSRRYLEPLSAKEFLRRI